MRIAQLELLAYGHFRGHTLDLEAPGLHVVFGRNEAGKSTTLRAITGLLYGIDRQTGDAHTHKPTDLRIGGVLVSEDGKRLRVVRRKGNTNTLLDPQGAPVAEEAMTRLLRGISQETFTHAFGLDHDALRKGAVALLEGKGDLGESLFDASVGGGGEVQRLLERLEKEADGLYRPRGQTQPLNDAIKAFHEAQKAIKEKQSLPEAFVTQEEHLRMLNTELAAKAESRKALGARRARLEAARQRVPLERKQTHLRAQREELGAVVAHVARLADLRERIVRYDVAVKAQRDHAAEHALYGDRVLEAARRAGVPAPGAAGAPEVRLDVKADTRLLKLVAERDQIVERLGRLAVELDRARRELARATELAAAAPPEDTTALQRALGGARPLGDAEKRLAADTAKLEKRRRDLEAKLAQAGLAGIVLSELASRPLPSADVVEALASRQSEAERRKSRTAEKVAELDAQALALEQQIGALAGAFAPPDAEELGAARAVRDAAWTKLRVEALDARARLALEVEVERALRQADELADRMIREADRVTRLSGLKSALVTTREQLAQKRAELEAIGAEAAATEAELAAAFEASGLRPKTVAEAKALVVRVAQLLEQHAEAADAAHEVEQLAASVARVREELSAALGKATGATSLAVLVDEVTTRIDAAEAQRRARSEAAKLAEQHAVTLQEKEAALAREEAAIADVRVRLAEIATPLGIAADASTEEATRALGALRDLFDTTAKRAEAAAKAEAAAREARAFEEEIARVASDLAPDLASLPARDAATELAARAVRAEAVVRELEDVEAHLAELGSAELPEDVVALAADAEGAVRALEELEAQLDALDEEIGRLKKSIGGAELGLAQMRGDSLAADEAAKAQEALARVRAHVERYTRAKIAATILAREIDRYREENQGPLLSRASGLFARLTLGAYQGVKAGFDEKDRPCLLCVRDGGVEVPVTGLSEGTRDQLYLSLRLSSLERHAEVAEPMPLVLDDVLIQLDDERARAALVVLAELAARTKVQVLFFTHHARLVELAREAIAAPLLHVHELGARATLREADAALG